MKARWFYLLTTLSADLLVLLTTLSEDLLVSWQTMIILVSWPAFVDLTRHSARTMYALPTHSFQVSRYYQLSVSSRNRLSRNRQTR